MKKYLKLFAMFLMFVFCTSCKGQGKTDLSKDNIKFKTKDVITSIIPNNITRNIIQDKKGNIWIAAFDGIFRYNGKSFTNITSKVSSSHFFSVLEDRRGNLWFGSIGSGVYCYDGKSFRNVTTKEGLSGNDVFCIYEDKIGNIWFGTDNGASYYNGKSFQNFTTKKGLSINGINSIIEDKTGKFWFATRGNTFVYDGKTFSILTHNGKPFTNIRSIIEDKKGNIWLGGKDGLWHYGNSIFTNFKENFVGYVYEDKKGNIWISSEGSKGWVLSHYNEKSLFDKEPTMNEINPNEGMICGILEANDGRIWFGASNGVYCYDGNTITDFKEKKFRKNVFSQQF